MVRVRVPCLPGEVSLRVERRAHDPMIPVRVRGLPALLGKEGKKPNLYFFIFLASIFHFFVKSLNCCEGKNFPIFLQHILPSSL